MIKWILMITLLSGDRVYVGPFSEPEQCMQAMYQHVVIPNTKMIVDSVDNAQCYKVDVSEWED